MNRFIVSAAAGLAGGAVGLWAMRYAMRGTKAAMDKLGSHDDVQHQADSSDMEGTEPQEGDEGFMSITGFHAREGEPATGALARGVYERLTGRELDEEREERASEWVHRGYGEAMGLGFALLAQGRGWGAKEGAFYGFLLWLLGDELVVPLLGLSKKPTEYSADMHVPALVAHVAYGAALGGVVGGAERLASD